MQLYCVGMTKGYDVLGWLESISATARPMIPVSVYMLFPYVLFVFLYVGSLEV